MTTQALFSRRALMALGLSVCASMALAADGEALLLVQGAVKTPLSLSLDALRSFPAEQIASYTVTRKIDGHEQSSSVRGVRLGALIERAGLLPTGHNDWKSLVVLATARDGYKVSFSWPELINTEVGAGVLVVFERDGQVLGADEGPIALVSARDLRSGPRHVKWLQRVELRAL